MAAKSKIVEVELPKSKAQIYYEEVEELKQGGMNNADAIREVAKKYNSNENAVRGGIFNWNRKLHPNGRGRTSGSNGPTATIRRLRQKAASADDYLLTAREALGSAIAALDADVAEAEAAVTAAREALAAAEAHRDQVVASVKDRKTDFQKKLDALS